MRARPVGGSLGFRMLLPVDNGLHTYLRGHARRHCAYVDTSRTTQLARAREKYAREGTGSQAAAPAQEDSYFVDLRWEGWQGFARLRITKKFPEEFAAFCKSLPPDVTLELRGELDSLGRDAIAGTVSLNVAEAGIDWFDLSVILDTSETDLTPAEIKLLLDARGGFVRLRGKGWRRLQFNLSPEEDERLAHLGLNPRELTSEPQRLHVLQLADPAARKFLPEEQFDRVQRRASELQARVTPDIPNGIAAELRPYQREGFHFLSYLTANRFGGILADDMGLGKTLQTLTWLKWLWSQKGNAGRTVLVVCPKSVMDNWRSETARFTADIRPRMWTKPHLRRLRDLV